jgi:hypothetical protein
MSFTGNRFFEVIQGIIDTPDRAQVSVRVHSFGSGSGSKQPGNLLVAFGLGFLGKSKVFAIRL